MSSSTDNGRKTIYLIRHAESTENHRIKSFYRCFGAFRRFSLPSKRDFYSGIEIYNVVIEVDSEVSERGIKQIRQSAELLKENEFVQKSGIELIVHSPFKRAVETCRGMLGYAHPDAFTDGDIGQHSIKRIVELDELIEKSPGEWIPGNKKPFLDRIVAFEKWLDEQEENVVAVVGHSQFFKAMLGLDFKFGNCDVWQVSYIPSNERRKDDGDGDDASATYGDEGEEKKEENETIGNGLPRGWNSLKRLYSIDEDSRCDERYCT